MLYHLGWVLGGVIEYLRGFKYGKENTARHKRYIFRR